MDTLTAPGSKVWDYTYDSGNRLTRVDIPNGMHTEYAYDTFGRQDAILHKDGTTVVQGFEYTFEDGGNITRIDHEDGAYWEYDYDDRDRLIEAERYDDTPTLLHRYAYTYDDGDNMLTKAVYDPSGPSTVTTTYTYNDANEQINMDDGTTSIDMTYDEWGRLVEKDDGTYTATYAYRYGSKLYSVASNFPGEGNVTYETGGDQKRRSRVAGASETWYNYTIGFDVISTEDDEDGSSGALTMTNVVRTPTAQVSATLADLAGATPSSGTARYCATDHLGSTRSAWSASKVAVGTYEFTPYGGEYNHTGAALDSLASAYTGKPWDGSAKFFHFPYRQYSPEMARWTTRDPLGMVDGPNLYGYALGSPVNVVDLLGLLSIFGHFSEVKCSARILSEWRDALEANKKKYGWFGQDKWFHCMSHCDVKKTCGNRNNGGAARGILREAYQRLKGDDLEDVRADLEANFQGIRCPEDKDCSDQCKEFFKKPKGY